MKEKENIHAKAESVEVEEGVQTTDKISVSLEVKGQNGFVNNCSKLP